MKTISEIRKNNLISLLKDSDSDKDFAITIGVEPGFLSQIKIGKNGNVNGRNIGNNLARKIEKKLDLEIGWIDATHSKGQIDFNNKDSYSELEKNIIKDFRSLSNSNKFKLLEIMVELKNLK